MHERVEYLKKVYKRSERYISPAAFLAGFIIDNITLTRIDLWFNNLLLFSYLLIAGASILLVHFIVGRKETQDGMGKSIALLLPIVTQFAFGALFSGYFVYYTRSGTIA